MSAREILAANRITMRDYSAGTRKVLCPKCSHTRRHKTDPCLSVTIDQDDGCKWFCHNCAWAGGASTAPAPRRNDYRPAKKNRAADWRKKFTSERRW